MSSNFPETSVTLLGRLAAQVTGEDEANWLRFWNLYAKAIRRFAVQVGDEDHADDVLSEVMRKLVDVFRGGRFDKDKGNFRSYLAQMVRNELGMAYRRERARRMDRRVYLDDDRTDEVGGQGVAIKAAERELATAGTAAPEALDAEWAAAQRHELEEHLLANPAVKPLYRDVWRALVREERSLDDVVAAFSISRNLACQIKSRMERALLGLAAELGA